MGTVTITSSGFSTLPVSAPTNWPTGITWPASGNINGSKTYTISDADAQQLLSWIAATYSAQLSGSPTALQIIVAWLNGFMAATTNSVQRQQYVPAAPPPPISIA